MRRVLSRGGLVLAAVLMLCLGAPLSAAIACSGNQQSCSGNYGTSEVFFGSGGSLDTTCSSTYCAKQAVGETAISLQGTTNANYQTGVLLDTPLRYYPLNETSGTTAHDMSGNGIDGTIHGGVTLSAQGLVGKTTDTAMKFNGSTGYISAPTTSLPTGTAAWSIDGWFSNTNPGLSSSQCIGSMGTFSTKNMAALCVQNSDEQGTLKGFDIFSGALNAGHKYYGTVTFDGTTLKLYLDGLLVANNTPTSPNLTQTFMDIGADNSGANDFFSGTIADVGIYGYALTQTQITNHFQLGQGAQAVAGFNTNRLPSLALLVNDPSCQDYQSGGVNLDLGYLSTASAKTANANFSVETYLADNYIITTSGSPPTNGSHTLSALTSGGTSTAGTEQFGMNLVANTSPSFGHTAQELPDSTFGFGGPTGGYDIPNTFKYNNGDVIASSTRSSGTSCYDLSYIYNISNVTPSGAYVLHQSVVATSTF